MDQADSRFPVEDLDTYASVYERDIDLALMAAIRSSAAIRDWLAGAVGFPCVDLLLVRHSWSTADHRESDIEVRFGVPTSAYVLQIENKLDARFQPGQQAAYEDRATSLSEEAEVVEARCALFCPAAYVAAEDCSRFDAVLTYEEARDVLLDEGSWGREAALLIQHAIVKHRRGGSDRPDDPVRTEFFRRMAEVAAAAGLPPVPPRPRKPNAGFLWWPRKEGLQQPQSWEPSGAHGAWLGAKLVHGSADIELIGVGAVCEIDELARRLEATGVVPEVSDASIRVRRAVPVLDPDRPLEEQRAAVDEVVGGLLEQRAWWHEVGHSLVEALIDSRRSAS